jgi:hypothetical protein
MPKQVDVYLEAGDKRTFAGAIDWPGWCRSGRDADAALQALFEYGPRYARVLSRARLGFSAPSDLKALVVVERLKGGAGTDSGAPGRSRRPITKRWMPRRCGERRLSCGPAGARSRGGRGAIGGAPGDRAAAAAGRRDHRTCSAPTSYRTMIGGKLKRSTGADLQAQLERAAQRSSTRWRRRRRGACGRAARRKRWPAPLRPARCLARADHAWGSKTASSSA